MGASNSTQRGPEERSCFGPRSYRSRPSSRQAEVAAEVKAAPIVDKENVVSYSARRPGTPRPHPNVMQSTVGATKPAVLKPTTVVNTTAPITTVTKPIQTKPAVLKPRKTSRGKFVEQVKSQAAELTKAKPPAKLTKTYTFKWTGEASTVSVAGTFSRWAPVSLEKVGDNEFVAALELKPKRYEYKFVIDGVWEHDPSSPVVSSGLGSLNNVLEDITPPPQSITTM